MAEVNPKNVLSKRSDHENKEGGSHGSKKCKELSSEILVPRGTNLTSNKREEIAHLSLRNLALHPDKEKSEVRNKIKRGKGEVRKCSSFSLSFSHSSSSENEEEDQETKRFHDVSNEDQCKLDLPSQLALYASRHISQRKAFWTQSVKYIMYQII